METQKIVNLLNDSDNESSILQQENGTLLMTKTNRQHGRGNENDSTVKFETKVIKPNLCD